MQCKFALMVLCLPVDAFRSLLSAIASSQYLRGTSGRCQNIQAARIAKRVTISQTGNSNVCLYGCTGLRLLAQRDRADRGGSEAFVLLASAKHRSSPTITLRVDAVSRDAVGPPVSRSSEHEAANALGILSAIRWMPRHSIANQLHELFTRKVRTVPVEFCSKLSAGAISEPKQTVQT
jgi:hypothetical protein